MFCFDIVKTYSFRIRDLRRSGVDANETILFSMQTIESQMANRAVGALAEWRCPGVLQGACHDFMGPAGTRGAQTGFVLKLSE
jgi:hypothetical protein